MRAAFLTCVELGLSVMEEIYALGGRLELVGTLPDDRAPKKAGRIYPDAFCQQHGIPLLKVAHVDDPALADAVRERAIDWLFIIGWSQIAGPAVLAAPARGALGMHPTLLPEGRGRAAIPWAILKGLPRTGVSLFRLAPGVDTGPVALKVELPLAPDETATRLYRRVAEAHRTLIRMAWPRLEDGTLTFTPQDETQASIWPGRTPEDGRILPVMRTADVERLVRASTHPYPGAFVEVAAGRLRIWQGRIGDPLRPPATAHRRIALADGVYDAIEFEPEP